MAPLRNVQSSPCPINPLWVPPKEIAIHADKLEEFITTPPAGLIYDNQDAWMAYCREWVGPVRKDGLAFIWVHGSPVPIHRFAYLLWVDDVPEGMYARPTVCGTKLCVKAEHLRLVTRGYRRRKLDDKERALIRTLYYETEGDWSQRRIAAYLGVSQTHVRRVIQHRDA